ncbi:hypothetical protein DSL72_005326 [Monilinia vaccinii-corymbosi]|uniref:GH16 domain-containing protein n=1 Tax=Monilinia vaccinii-corymbosi TaxID=61207 RepID=A0A8A3PFB6_9HELO|nr:hypothetical protein DSL72_005326 [Monilinia vaccinii-corymbosi]
MKSSYRSAASFQNSGKLNASFGLLRKDELKNPSSIEPRWWDVRAWSKKKLAIAGAGLIVLITVVVVVPVRVLKNRPYPNYSKLKYSLKDTYSGTDFFDNFDYFDAPDPSGGFVQYADSEVAAQYNLTYASSSRSVVRVDASATAHSNRSTSDGRLSVRISSKKQYEDGLIIFDVVHTPIGCGTWPALWMSDVVNWPTNGEIDILEAVNVISSARNQMALHTTSGCTMKSVKRKQTGKTIHST